MRELKFRVFDTQQNKFLAINDYIDETWQFNGVAGFKNMGVLAYQIRENGLNSKLIFDDERFKIEQFAGLKDCKGREIYEGDIIKINTIAEVLFNSGCFEIFTKARMNGQGGCVNCDELLRNNLSCEVIGNIYENLEILKC